MIGEGEEVVMKDEEMDETTERSEMDEATERSEMDETTERSEMDETTERSEMAERTAVRGVEDGKTYMSTVQRHTHHNHEQDMGTPRHDTIANTK